MFTRQLNNEFLPPTYQKRSLLDNYPDCEKVLTKDISCLIFRLNFNTMEKKLGLYNFPNFCNFFKIRRAFF